MEIKIESTVKGTRILTDETAKRKREIINQFSQFCIKANFNEIMIPIIQHQETFKGKVGNENQKMMYEFQDAGGRELCLAPEYTAVIMQLAKTTYRMQKDVKLFYMAECFRGEKPQAGRYRQFTQFGVEIINPSKIPENYPSILAYVFCMAKLMIGKITGYPSTCEFNQDAVRGLDYYKEGKGFEITCPQLGAQKQVVGGGEYPGGVGFAIGIDRLLLLNKNENGL